MSTITKQLGVTKNWLLKNAPNLFPLLNSPATEDEILSVEEKFSVKFSPALRELYLHHNGESEESCGIFGCYRLIPLDRMGREIEVMQHKNKIPVFLSGGGDSYYVKSHNVDEPDFRLFECLHENPEHEYFISSSLLEFLEEFNDALDRGQYIVDPDDEEFPGLIDRDEL